MPLVLYSFQVLVNSFSFLFFFRFIYSFRDFILFYFICHALAGKEISVGKCLVQNYCYFSI